MASAPRPRLRAALKFLPAPALALLVLLVVQPVLARYGHDSASGWACWSVAVPLLLLNAARGALRGTAVPLPAWLRWADLVLLAAVLGYAAAVLREFTTHPALVLPAVLAPPLLVALRKLRRR